jgi:glyoxylase I family protein
VTLAGFHHVALTVHDLDASVTWYQEVLGLEVHFREDGDTRRACVFRFPDGGFAVGLVEHASEGGSGFDPTRRGLDHLAFAVRSRDELVGWANRLDEHGVAHSGAVDAGPGAILNFTDPDGIALALFWDKP